MKATRSFDKRLLVSFESPHGPASITSLYSNTGMLKARYGSTNVKFVRIINMSATCCETMESNHCCEIAVHFGLDQVLF